MKREGQALIAAAREARGNAYAPYSRYEVGAAVSTPSPCPETFAGANVENASYGATICAERAAVVQAISAGYRALSAIAVVTPGKVPAPPCGMCLQVLSEFCDDMVVYLAAADGRKVVETRLSALLPDRFGVSSVRCSR